MRFISLCVSLLFSFALTAQACDEAPAGFVFREIRLTMEYTPFKYRYYIHVEFPDLKKVCWLKTADGHLMGGLPGETIKIRGSTLDEKESNVMDEISAADLRLDIQPNPSFWSLSMGHSPKYNTSFMAFYSAEQNYYMIATVNLWTLGDTNVIATDVLEN
jgi:hypothetical protein